MGPGYNLIIFPPGCDKVSSRLRLEPLEVELCERLCMMRAGLVLVTGATGAGKSTSLAAMIDHINRDEDPLWLTGDFVGALSAVTGQHLGYDATAWRRWWHDHRGG